jgi:serine/threonine protein kinase
VKATFKDANELRSGTFSTTYKAVMPSGMVVCVKKLKSVDRAVIHHQTKMIRELERLAHINHPNLVRPIGYVIYEDVALLLQYHMPNGTLLQLLHDANSCDGENHKPDWPKLLSIAINVAEGLAFLHQIATIHLDISSGNVFLDSHYNALLGEVEISKLLDPSKGTASISAVAGTFGYIPPGLNFFPYVLTITQDLIIRKHNKVFLFQFMSCRVCLLNAGYRARQRIQLWGTAAGNPDLEDASR